MDSNLDVELLLQTKFDIDSVPEFIASSIAEVREDIIDRYIFLFKKFTSLLHQ